MLFLCYFFLLFLLLFRAKCAPFGGFFEDSLAYSSVLPLRGFFMLLIVFHHISQLLAVPGSLKLFQGIGILCVSFFFFQSGYGVMKNYLQKENYMHGFLFRRFCKLLLPFFLCNLVFFVRQSFFRRSLFPRPPGAVPDRPGTGQYPRLVYPDGGPVPVRLFSFLPLCLKTAAPVYPPAVFPDRLCLLLHAPGLRPAAV